jgi:hypothetical protein
VSVLLIVAVAALAAMFVLCCLPSLADRTTELQTGSMNRREQAEQDISTAANETGPTSDADQVVVQLWVCILTLPQLAMLSAADRQCCASLHTTQHKQRLSENCTQGVVRQTNVHVAVCD